MKETNVVDLCCPQTGSTDTNRGLGQFSNKCAKGNFPFLARDVDKLLTFSAWQST